MKLTALLLGVCCLWSAVPTVFGQVTIGLEFPSYSVTEGDTLNLCVEAMGGSVSRNVPVTISIPLTHIAPGAQFDVSVTLTPQESQQCTDITIPNSPSTDGTVTTTIILEISAADEAMYGLVNNPTPLFIFDTDAPPSSSVMPSPSSVTMPESSSMAMPESSSMDMTESSSIVMPDSSSVVMPDSSSMAMPESSSMFMPSPSPTMTASPSPTPTPLPSVRLSLPEDSYSVEEGETLQVTVEAYNPADEAQSVSGIVVIFLSGDQESFSTDFNISVPANSTAMEEVEVTTSELENDILDVFPQRLGFISLPVTSSNAFVTSFGSTFFIVDDDFIELGFDEHQVSFYENEGLVHICVQLLEGEGCRRPVAIRVYTRECSGDAYPAEQGSDFERLLDIVTLDINSEEDDLFCAYVQLIDDDRVENNETFKLVMDVVDINAFVPEEYRTVVVTILNDDVVMCPEFEVMYGSVNFTTLEVGGTATTMCDDFFSLSGSAMRTCMEDGNWTGEEPTCSPDPISLDCSSELVGGNIDGPLNVSCIIAGPFEITNITCNYDNGSLVEDCDADMLIDFDDFDPGNHTLVVMVMDAEGQTAESDPIEFTVFRPLNLQCVQEASLPFQFAFSCSGDNELASNLSCYLFEGLVVIHDIPCPAGFSETATIGQPPLVPGANFTIQVTGTDVFGDEDTVDLEFSVEEIPELILQFVDDTPNVFNNEVNISFSSNLPLESADCTLRDGTGNCIIREDGFGGDATFTGLVSQFRRLISVSASSFGRTAQITRNVRSDTTGQCSVHFTNDRSTMTADNVTVTVQLIGPSADDPVTNVRCRIRVGGVNGPWVPCGPPVVVPIGLAIDQAGLVLGPGEQSLCVQPVDSPQGRGGRCSREQFVCLDLDIPT